jgi:hypothetical protein
VACPTFVSGDVISEPHTHQYPARGEVCEFSFDILFWVSLAKLKFVCSFNTELQPMGTRFGSLSPSPRVAFTRYLGWSVILPVHACRFALVCLSKQLHRFVFSDSPGLFRWCRIIKLLKARWKPKMFYGHYTNPYIKTWVLNSAFILSACRIDCCW